MTVTPAADAAYIVTNPRGVPQQASRPNNAQQLAQPEPQKSTNSTALALRGLQFAGRRPEWLDERAPIQPQRLTQSPEGKSSSARG